MTTHVTPGTLDVDPVALRERVLAEAERFRAVLPALLPMYGERWVVFRDGEVASAHATEEEAYVAGLERFGPQGGQVVALVREAEAVMLSALIALSLQMFTHHGTVSSGSLLVQARISVHPSLAGASGLTRPGHSLVMELDTGARFSLVAEHLLTNLGVAPTGFTPVRTSLHAVAQRPVYRIVVSVEFADDFGNRASADVLLGVIGAPPPPANLPGGMVVPHLGLLGLDFLQHFRLTYDGPGNQVQLTCSQLPRLRASPVP